MLVYHKDKMGYTTIGGKRVYGPYFNYGKFGPTDIPRSDFKKNIDILEEVEYNKEILSKIFGCNFPTVKFKISELWKLDFNKLIEVAKLMGINYIPNIKPTDIQRRGLRKSVINCLTD